MKVVELIERLKQFPSDALVVAEYESGYGKLRVQFVWKDEHGAVILSEEDFSSETNINPQ